MAKPKDKEAQPLVKSAPPSSRALSPFEEMDRMFEHFFGRSWPRSWMAPMRWEMPAWPEMPRLPKVDVIDQDNAVVVKAEVSGVKKEDIDISVSDTMVTIRGRTRHEEKEEKGDYFRSEISRGEFSRTVALPCDVDGDKATARMEDGLLTLTLPKLEKAKRRPIKVE